MLHRTTLYNVLLPQPCQRLRALVTAVSSFFHQAELQLARYSDCLAHLPFLDQLLTNGMRVQENHIMQTLAQRAVAILDSAEDDVVFCHGCLVHGTFFHHCHSIPCLTHSIHARPMPYMPYKPLHAITCHTRAAPMPFFIHSSWLFHGFSLGFIMNLGQGQVCTVCEVCAYFLDFLGKPGSGCRADATYFTLHGALSYLKNDDPTRVRFGQWISEMCLWTEWFHVGDLLSVSRLLAFVQCARH